jgi:ubiquinone/menaquinone biosynthesis C-methylase UbiE
MSSVLVSTEYNAKATGYDQCRTDAPGWAVLSPLLDAAGLAGKKLFDSGCGTGAFLQQMIDKGVSELHAYDPSPAMMAKAQEKVGKMSPEDAAKITLISGNPPSYPENTFDCVTSLQVVQNLTPDDPRDSPIARAGYLGELFRMLVPGGVCAVTTRYRLQDGISTSTYGDMYWYADNSVAPTAVAFMELAVPQDPAGELSSVGFVDCKLMNSPDTMINTVAYNDASRNNIADSAFRAADSFFSRLDADEMAALTAHVQGLLDAGKLEEYITERSRLRGSFGQVGVFTGTKPCD